MLQDNAAVSRKGLVDRALAMITRPKVEWPLIAAETETVGTLFSSYIVILAALPVLINFLRMTVIGVSVPFGGRMHFGIGMGVSQLVLGYGLSLVGVFLVALVVEALAPSFGGQKNRVQAVKTVAYTFTVSWVASIAMLLPWLGMLVVFAAVIYAIYVMYLGLPFTMKCPPDKAAGYTAVVIIATFILYLVVGAVIAGVTGMGASMAGLGHPSYTGGSTTNSDDVTFDKDSPLGKLQEIGKQAQVAGKKMEDAQKTGDANAQADAMKSVVAAALGGGSKVEALAPDQLKSFVPETFGGMKRSTINVERNGALGLQVSKAEATYTDGPDHLVRLHITDLGSARGVMSLAAWAGAEQDQESDHGYDKTYKSGNRWIHEKWDNKTNEGEYGLVIADRFAVSAEGPAKSIDDLKAAVGGIDLGGLEAMKETGVQKN